MHQTHKCIKANFGTFAEVAQPHAPSRHPERFQRDFHQGLPWRSGQPGEGMTSAVLGTKDISVVDTQEKGAPNRNCDGQAPGPHRGNRPPPPRTWVRVLLLTLELAGHACPEVTPSATSHARSGAKNRREKISEAPDQSPLFPPSPQALPPCRCAEAQSWRRQWQGSPRHRWQRLGGGWMRWRWTF